MFLKNIIGQNEVIELFKKNIANKHLAHAYLLAGPPGSGKNFIAYTLAKAINCKDFNGEICGRCEECRLFDSGNHPDTRVIKPSGNYVRINQIHDLRKAAALKSYRASYKIFIIDEAEKMTVPAANSFLKTLEEPLGETIIFLLTSQPNFLLKTIYSRCQLIQLKPVPMNILEKHLVEKFKLEVEHAREISIMSEGCIGRSINLMENLNKNIDIGKILKELEKASFNKIGAVFKIIENCGKKNTKEILELLNAIFRDILILKTTKNKDLIYNSNHMDFIEKETGRFTEEDLFEVISLIEQAKIHISQNINMNLLLENLFLKIALMKNEQRMVLL